VGRGIVVPEVRFDLDDARRQQMLSVIAYQYLAEEFASQAAWRAGEEGTLERVSLAGSDFFRFGHW
jgi:hypothetical protein